MHCYNNTIMVGGDHYSLSFTNSDLPTLENEIITPTIRNATLVVLIFNYNSQFVLPIATTVVVTYYSC